MVKKTPAHARRSQSRAAEGIVSKTPFLEPDNPPFLIVATCGTVVAVVLAMQAGRPAFPRKRA